jgi:alpha-amylase/alpha-mannosidase (GH57 family)
MPSLRAWRRPLRSALDWLRDELNAVFESSASQLFVDHWAARNDYIRLILDRSSQNKDILRRACQAAVLSGGKN